MRAHIFLAAVAVLAPAAVAAAGTQDCASGSCTINVEATAWAQVARGVEGGSIAWPRKAQGAAMQRIDLTRQQPDGEATVCDGRQEATGRYLWRGRSVTFRNVTAAGSDCTKGDPLRFRCSTVTISGLGRSRNCTSTTWRILTWGNYVPRVGGRYEISAPRAFPVVAMARSVR